MALPNLFPRHLQAARCQLTEKVFQPAFGFLDIAAIESETSVRQVVLALTDVDRAEGFLHCRLGHYSNPVSKVDSAVLAVVTWGCVGLAPSATRTASALSKLVLSAAV